MFGRSKTPSDGLGHMTITSWNHSKNERNTFSNMKWVTFICPHKKENLFPFIILSFFLPRTAYVYKFSFFKVLIYTTASSISTLKKENYFLQPLYAKRLVQLRNASNRKCQTHWEELDCAKKSPCPKNNMLSCNFLPICSIEAATPTFDVDVHP